MRWKGLPEVHDGLSCLDRHQRLVDDRAAHHRIHALQREQEQERGREQEPRRARLLLVPPPLTSGKRVRVQSWPPRLTACQTGTTSPSGQSRQLSWTACCRWKMRHMHPNSAMHPHLVIQPHLATHPIIDWTRCGPRIKMEGRCVVMQRNTPNARLVSCRRPLRRIRYH